MLSCLKSPESEVSLYLWMERQRGDTAFQPPLLFTVTHFSPFTFQDFQQAHRSYGQEVTSLSVADEYS